MNKFAQKMNKYSN